MTEIIIPHREMRLAESVVHKITAGFARRKFKPVFSSYNITRVAGMTLLIIVLDTTSLGDQSPYTNADLLHQLSTDLGGTRVYLSNTTGIRYVVVLSSLPKLPRKIELPVDLARGKVALGIRFSGQVVLVTWESFTHMAVLGKSGSGKSVFLRLLVYQAMRDDMRLLLSDIDQTTFGMLEDNPALLAPLATTPTAAFELMEKAMAECDRRAELFMQMPERPEKLSEYNSLAVLHALEPLPRILVVLDEASSVLSAMGGAKGVMGQALATLGWRGRKFGIHMVFAAQEFTKDIIGPIRDQVGLTICFNVRNGSMAERMGCRGADRIPEGRAGLAISDRYGPIQTYFVDKSLFGNPLNKISILTDIEFSLFTRAQVEGGKLPKSKVQEWGGVSEWQARQLMETWALKGWLCKDANRDNAFCITPKGQVLLSNHPTAQTASSHLKPSQTGQIIFKQ